MPKGHSTLEPRIQKLEELAAWQAKVIDGLQRELTTAHHSKAAYNETHTGSRIAALERRIAQMDDAFSRGNLPSPLGHGSQWTQ